VVASLIFGPFAIMAVFGIGYRGDRDPFRTEIVTSASSGLPTDAAFYDKLADGRLDVVRVSHDAAAAQARLRQQQVDFVVSAPSDAEAQLKAGKQSVLNVSWNEVDPVSDGLANFAVYTLVHELNSEIIRSEHPTGCRCRADPGADDQRGADQAPRSRFLRTGGLRAGAAAPGGDAHRSLDGA